MRSRDYCSSLLPPPPSFLFSEPCLSVLLILSVSNPYFYIFQISFFYLFFLNGQVSRISDWWMKSNKMHKVRSRAWLSIIWWSLAWLSLQNYSKEKPSLVEKHSIAWNDWQRQNKPYLKRFCLRDFELSNLSFPTMNTRTARI